MKKIENLLSILNIPEAEKQGIIIEFEAQEEDLDVRGQIEDEKEIQNICDSYNRGNLCAWFCAKVTVKYRGYEEDDYLGGCSYSSFDEFLKTDNDYYLQMINDCIDQINKYIESENTDIQKRWNIRRAKNLIKDYDLFIVPNLKMIAL